MPVSLTMLAALLALQATNARPAAQPPVVVTGQLPPGEQPKVCKWSGTGTMFPKRICRTADEWSKEEGNAEQAIEQMREIQHGARCSDFRC